MNYKNPEKLSVNSKRQRLVVWFYYFHCQDMNKKMEVVCKSFLLKLFQISEGRLKSVQCKLLQKKSLEDFRGVNGSHNLKLTDDLQNLIRLHCTSLPHRGSHYSHESTSLNYFKNPELNLKILYDLFLDYHASVTGDLNAPIAFSTYEKFFNYNCNFSFNLPRTDVCNICFESEKMEPMTEEVSKHKKKARDYFVLKKKLMDELTSLSLEFDFAQNLPLPKIPVSDQFFRRLMWMYVFNVHVHNNNNSYMFLIPEGLYKKGANTVCNFVYHVIKNELDPEKYVKVNLFSDACGGQNRNFMVVRFFSSLSENVGVPIDYLFPVRGHSFNKCDQNFGVYSKKKKLLERIETQKEYYDLIKNSREPQFIVLDESEWKIVDYEKVLGGTVKNFPISKAFYLQFDTHGKVKTQEKYFDEQPKTIEIEPQIKFSSINPVPPPIVGMAEAKVNDVKVLLKYLKPESQVFFTKHFEKVGLKRTSDKSTEARKVNQQDIHTTTVSTKNVKKTNALKSNKKKTKKK